jgi:adenylate cyclase
LGLLSVNSAEAALRVAVAVWHSRLGSVLLYGAATTHLALALVSIYERRTLRMPALEAVRVALGFGIPLLLIGHLATTRFAFELYGLTPDYARIVWTLWTSDGEGKQLALLVPGWLHGCLGLKFAFERRPLFQRMRPWLSAGAVVLPILAALGFFSMGRQLVSLGANSAWLEAHVPLLTVHQKIRLEQLRHALLLMYLGAVGLTFAARELRALFERNGKTLVTISYPGRTVRVPRGWTVLEASRYFRHSASRRVRRPGAMPDVPRPGNERRR